MLWFFLCFIAFKMIDCSENKSLCETNNSKYVHPCLRKYWSSNAMNHAEGKTFIEITNFLHGYIINMKNMDPKGRCSKECEDFTNAKTEHCFRNKWCQKQPRCSNIIKCQFRSSAMEVCLSEHMHKSKRRYEYIKHRKHNEFGIKDHCKTGNSTFLESQIRGVFDICDYCFCTCEENPTPHSDRYINLRTVMANISDNRVVTGIRFVKRHGIIHFQIEDAKLMPFGKIDSGTKRWVPTQNYKITDDKVHEGKDYHKLSWKRRSMHLNEVMVKKGSVITGVRFKRIGGNFRLHLSVVSTPYDSATGRLINPESSSSYKIHRDVIFTNKFGKELKLTRPDIPTRVSPDSEIIYTIDKFVKFTHTDFEKDAAQTTVPFFDAQPVQAESSLRGIGIFHKGQEGSGGFVAPVIFTYDENEC